MTFLDNKQNKAHPADLTTGVITHKIITGRTTQFDSFNDGSDSPIRAVVLSEPLNYGHGLMCVLLSLDGLALQMVALGMQTGNALATAVPWWCLVAAQ